MTAHKQEKYVLPNGAECEARLCGTHRKETEEMVKELVKAIEEQGEKTREANAAEHQKTRLLFQQKTEPAKHYPALKVVEEAA